MALSSKCMREVRAARLVQQYGPLSNRPRGRCFYSSRTNAAEPPSAAVKGSERTTPSVADSTVNPPSNDLDINPATAPVKTKQTVDSVSEAQATSESSSATSSPSSSVTSPASSSSASSSSTPLPTPPDSRISSFRSNTAYHPTKYSRRTLLEHGHNSSTLAARNYTGVIVDRLSTIVDINSVTNSAISTSDRDGTSGIVKRLQNQEIVRFESRSQFDDISTRIGAKIHNHLLRNDSRRKIAKSLVAGHYTKPVKSDTANDTNTDTVNARQQTLNALQNVTRLNGTYHDGDVDKLTTFVKKLLPASTATTTARGGQTKARSRAVKA